MPDPSQPEEDPRLQELLVALAPLVGRPVIVSIRNRDHPMAVLNGSVDRVETVDEIVYVRMGATPPGTKVILPAKALGTIEQDIYEPRDLLIELADGAVVFRDVSPLSRLVNWRRHLDSARSEAEPTARLGRLRLLAALLEADLDITEDPDIRHATEILLSDVRTIIKAEERFTIRPQEPPQVDDLDDPDWQW